MAKTNEIWLCDDERTVGFIATAVSYRIPWAVTKVMEYAPENTFFSVCPRCRKSLEREYMSFCDRCGQKLNWDLFEFAKVVTYSDLNGQ